MHYINIVIRTLRVLIFSAYARIKACMWGIQVGKGFKVNGKIHFRRLPKSSISIGEKCRFNSSSNSNLIGINRPCIIATHDKTARIVIGHHSGFSGTVIGAFKSVTIGNYVKCGANSLITDSDWHSDDPRSAEPKPVVIGDNVWLGEGTKVLKGVTIGENSLIGAGSVVVKDIPANVIAAGNPCKIIRHI
ncbi:MAG: acyltransferase [Cyclobacteriaceae bacterium]|nr:acyltransferase [Cyclobacteriaceae bacterium]